MLNKGATIPQNKHNQFTQKPVYILTENEYQTLIKKTESGSVQEERRLQERVKHIERENELLNEIQILKRKVSDMEEEIKALKFINDNLK